MATENTFNRRNSKGKLVVYKFPVRFLVLPAISSELFITKFILTINFARVKLKALEKTAKELLDNVFKIVQVVYGLDCFFSRCLFIS